jgi:hypothetical protein
VGWCINLTWFVGNANCGDTYCIANKLEMEPCRLLGSWAFTCMLRHMGFRVCFVRGDIYETEPEKALTNI